MNEPKGGKVIAGKFRLEWPIGRGGMGTVWAAMHLQLDMPVAVKFMDPSAADADGRQRFEREARAIAQLRSPHVVQVLDHGVDNGMPYIVMELLEGEDLEARLRRMKKLPLLVALRIFTQSAKALRRAHDAGIVHRDLKPNNVFLARVDDEEVVKLLDFGVAKMAWTGALDPHNESTQQGLLLGSPCYMSPEQARGNKNIDHRSDLWALAVILFRSITGVRPFDANTIADLIIKICAEPPPIASQIAPDLPPGLDDFFLRAFSQDPDQRYQSALEMASDFEALVRSKLPATETFSGGRIVSQQRTATNPSMAAINVALPPQRTTTNPSMAAINPPQRTATNPSMAAINPPQRTKTNPAMPALNIPQRAPTNPAMRAITLSGQLDAPRRTSTLPPAPAPSNPSYDAPLPPAPSPSVDRYAPPQVPSGVTPYASPARLSWPGDLPSQPAPQPTFGAGSYSATQPMQSPPMHEAYGSDPSATIPMGLGYGGYPPHEPYAQQAQGQVSISPAAAEIDYPGAEQPSSPPGEEGQPQGAGPFSDVSSPSVRLSTPDSSQTAEALGSTSNTLRERSPSGRQLVVWTGIAAMLTAILVVAIVIVARARMAEQRGGPAARPQGTTEIGAPQPPSTQQTAPQQPQQAPPPDGVAPQPPGAPQQPPPSGALPGPGSGVGSPSGAGAASASAPAGAPSVPFAPDEDAGPPAAPPPATQGPKPTWTPSGRKPKPNFGY